MGIKLILLLFIIGKAKGSSSLLKPCVGQEQVLSQVLRDVVSQNKLKGLLLLNTIYRNESKSAVSSVNHLFRHASALTTVVYVNDNFEQNCYLRNISRLNPRGKKKILMHSNLVTTDSTFSIATMDHSWLVYHKKWITRCVRVMRQYFCSIQGVSKTLLIFMVNKRFSKYESLLRRLAKASYTNIDVLEVQRNPKTRSYYKFRLVQFNPYDNTLTNRPYKPGMPIFLNLANDLHNTKLIVQTDLQEQVIIKNWTPCKNYTGYSCLYYFRILYSLETALTQMNASWRHLLYRKLPHRHYYDMSFMPCGIFPRAPEVDTTFIYPAHAEASYFMAPSFYDEITRQTYDVLLSSLFLIIISIFIFCLWSRWFEFDRQTWEPMMVFSMIISVGNPRDPVRAGEYVMFMCLITVAFFFGSDWISGLTEITISTKEERRVQTLDEVRANNITLAFCKVHRLSWTDKELGSLKYKVIGDDFESSRKLYEHVTDMLKHQNLSLSTHILNLLDVQVPQKISMIGKVYARLSFIKESSYTGDMILAVWKRNRAWLNRLNNNLLRFNEYRLKNHPVRSYEKYNIYRKHFGKYSEQLTLEILQEKEDSLITSMEDYYWMILVISGLISLFLLILEVYFFRIFCCLG